MSDDKKLRLVPPPDAMPFEEPPPTEAELAEAEAIRLALEEGTEPISNALRAANAPTPLSPPDHDALLARALGDVLAPPTQLEAASADRLARELGGEIRGEGSSSLQLVRALRSAHAPRGLDQVTHERILKKALGTEAKKASPTRARSSRIVVVSGLFVAAAAFALFFMSAARKSDSASSVAMAPAPAGTAAATADEAPADRAANAPAPMAAAKGGARSERAKAAKESSHAGRVAAAPPPQAASGGRWATAPNAGEGATVAAAYIPSRSTDDLFEPGQQFPKTGGESARIDRIAMARASDLRQNRFAAWGVR